MRDFAPLDEPVRNRRHNGKVNMMQPAGARPNLPDIRGAASHRSAARLSKSGWVACRAHVGGRSNMLMDRIAVIRHRKQFIRTCRCCGDKFTGPLKFDIFHDGAPLADIKCVAYLRCSYGLGR